MKKAKDLFSIIMVILLGIAVWKWYAFSQQEKMFDAQPLDVSIANLENVWGKPDKIFEDTGIVYFYKSQNGLGHHYVFRFDKNQKLIGKYYDD